MYKQIISTFSPRHFLPLYSGFTLVELMITVSITSILIGIAVPNYSSFICKLRVNNEISELNRLLLIARNTAINNRQTVTLCHLDESGKCDTNWHQQLSVFIDTNANKIYEPNLNEYILRVKSKIKTTDKLHYGIGRTGVIYAATGRLAGWGSNGTFRYCPLNYQNFNRGIRVATSGRLYITTDTDHDGKDEDRNGKELTCR